jgi:hypothetical protein
LAHAFLLWEYSYKWLKLAQLLCQLGVFLTLRTVTGLSPFSAMSQSAIQPPSRLPASEAKSGSEAMAAAEETEKFSCVT